MNKLLREYQREGIQFLYQAFLEDTGAILGDSMGLGKTIQTIGFLLALASHKEDNEALRNRPGIVTYFH